MPEAVIVATARTPIGRANKGSLTECRPDDLSAHIIKAVLDKVPSLDPETVEDVIWGCGQPGGEAGYNVARVAAILAGLADVPGVTVNRYCSSSLQTIRMAAHAIRAGEGDVFISAGVEAVSRYQYGAAGPNAFDCSGLAYYSYRKAGFTNIPRTSRQQAAAFRPVKRSNMRPGDLVFFHNNGSVYHMGVYVGWKNGRRTIIHASRSGTPVKRDPIWTNSWFARTLR